MTIQIPAGPFEPSQKDLTALLDAVWRASGQPASTLDNQSAQLSLVAHKLDAWMPADFLRIFVYAKEAGLIGYNLDNDQSWLTDVGFIRRRP